MVLINKLRNILRYYKTGKELYRKGGITYVPISYVTPNNEFRGRKILVTGGGSGIGLSIAKMFLSEGAEVIICGRNINKLKSVCLDINNDALHILEWDISNIDIIEQKFSEMDSILSNIDSFINCAGISDYSNNDMMSENTYDQIMSINTKALFFMCKHEGDYLKKNNIQGKIVNITSKAGELFQFDPYTLSKWGANSITLGLAKRLAPFHINVNAIAPGCVPTDITKELQSHINDRNQYRQEHSTHRFTQAEEIAHVAKFLCSDSSKNIVGQIIAVDGGIY